MKKTLLLLTFSFSSLFAEGGSTQGSYVQSIVMILLAVVFFYFILWRPEQKRRKTQEARRNSLKAGDKVTALGMLGTIDSVEEKTVILKTIDGSKIEILKAAVTDVNKDEDKTIEINKKK